MVSPALEEGSWLGRGAGAGAGVFLKKESRLDWAFLAFAISPVERYSIVPARHLERGSLWRGGRGSLEWDGVAQRLFSLAAFQSGCKAPVPG